MVKLLLGSFGLVGLLGATVLYRATSMPRESFEGELPEPDAEEEDAARRLRANVEVLALELGERNLQHPAALSQTRDHLQAQVRELGLTPVLEGYSVGGETVANVVAELKGTSRPEAIVLVGAHYDSARGTRGANDNATGVATLLELARAMAGTEHACTLRLVWFVNEEPPHFKRASMGSDVHARRAHERGDALTAMLSLETLGYYTDEPGTQRYPSPFMAALYPDRGNFVAFVGTSPSRALVRRALDVFRKTTPFPSEGMAAPPGLTGADWSDHWAFAREGYQAIMVTDTAYFRDPHYHRDTDHGAQIDYRRLAAVSSGIQEVVRALCREPNAP